VLGTCNLTQIHRGPSQSCNLGYTLDVDAVGHGFLTEALETVILFAFEKLHLHRIEANYIPTNERSGRVLRRLGFTVEGYARDYLDIAGAWRDHILTARTNSALAAPPVSGRPAGDGRATR